MEKTKERTVLIRKESDFLYLEYYNVVRYCDNDFIKQLNVECDENAKEIAVSLKASDGYSVITMPFNFSLYQTLSTEEKNVFWVEEITKVFNFVLPLGQFTRNYTQTVKRAADNKRRYAPGEGSIPPVLLSGVSKGVPPLAHDFACKV